MGKRDRSSERIPTLDDLRNDGERLLDTFEVAAITRLPEATLRRWRHIANSGGKNKCPASADFGGKLVYYSSKVVIAWIDEQLARAK